MVITGPAVGDWVAERISVRPTWEPNYRAVGWTVGGRIVLGVVYERYIPGRNIEMHVACEFCPRRALPEAFLYPFAQLKLPRVTGLVPASNTMAIECYKHLGFVEEGRMRRACIDGDDLIVLGMLREECRFIREPWLSVLKGKQ